MDFCEENKGDKSIKLTVHAQSLESNEYKNLKVKEQIITKNTTEKNDTFDKNVFFDKLHSFL